MAGPWNISNPIAENLRQQAASSDTNETNKDSILESVVNSQIKYYHELTYYVASLDGVVSLLCW